MSTAIIAVVAFLLGILTTAGVFVLSFRLAARYQRTGHADAPIVQGERDSAPADANASAHRRALEDSIKKGADDIMAIAEASGQRMTREEAEADAKAILAQIHATTPLGGVN